MRLVVYGTLAAVVVVVLVARSSGGPETVELNGRTTRGEAVQLKLVDGRLESFDLHTGVTCPKLKVWHGWKWAAKGPFGGEGARFEYGDRNRFPDGGRFISVMRGRVTDDGSGARGTINTRGTWPTESGRTACQSSLAFEASEKDG